MTNEGDDDEDEIEDLSIVYGILRKDMKLMITDLNNGVSMWKMGSILMACLAVLGFFLAWVFINPRVLEVPLIYISSLAGVVVGLASSLGTAITYRKYKSLRRKYSRLFEIVSKLK